MRALLPLVFFLTALILGLLCEPEALIASLTQRAHLFSGRPVSNKSFVFPITGRQEAIRVRNFLMSTDRPMLELTAGYRRPEFIGEPDATLS